MQEYLQTTEECFACYMSMKVLVNYEYAQANTHFKKLKEMVRKYTA